VKDGARISDRQNLIGTAVQIPLGGRVLNEVFLSGNQEVTRKVCTINICTAHEYCPKLTSFDGVEIVVHDASVLILNRDLVILEEWEYKLLDTSNFTQSLTT